MSFWTPQNFHAVTQGKWISPPADPLSTLKGVSTDTRTVTTGQVFIALAGERYDGHDYLASAINSNAAMLLVSQTDKLPDDTRSTCVLQVSDTLLALQQLAAAYRKHLGKAGVKVIAVGGSNGKTTTRHLIHSVLLATLKGTQSPKSFNNHIGVPLTLLAASEKDDFVVVEVGTNHPGEIDPLGQMVKPDVAVITNIGREHLAFFKDLEGVAREEAALLGHVQSDGLVLLPGEPSQQKYLQPFLHLLPSQVKLQWFGSQSETGQNTRTLESDKTGSRFTDAQGLAITLPLLGRHNVDNALAAIAAARWLHVTDADIAIAMGSASGVSMRMEISQLGQGDRTLTLINDAYNANPDSMRAALETLATMTPAAGSRRVAILGDMLELGDLSPLTHRELGQFAVQLDTRASQASKTPPGSQNECLGLVVLIGKMAMFAAGELGRAWPDRRFVVIPQWDDQVPGRVASMLNPGDIVLIKASRGMALERLLPAIELQMTNPHTPAHTPQD